MLDLILRFGNFISEDAFLWICALAGSGLFVIQFILNLFGALDQELNEGSDAGDFKWISKQALIGFLMMFGWVALTSRKEFGLSGPLSALLGFGGGLIAIFLTGLIFRSAKKTPQYWKCFQHRGCGWKRGSCLPQNTQRGSW